MGGIDKDLLIGLGIASVVMFVGSLLAVPIVLARIPADYFVRERPRTKEEGGHPVLRIAGRILKNLAGAVFLLAGIAMLALPGQGLLTIFIGLWLLDFPGKRKLELKLIRRPRVLRSINWLRRKAKQPPLRVDGVAEHAADSRIGTASGEGALQGKTAG